MKIAIYPGSFNPWHEGHSDVLTKTHVLFDKVVIAVGINPEKDKSEAELNHRIKFIKSKTEFYGNVVVDSFRGFLIDYAKSQAASAIVRGLRNASDLESERTQQYWNEDLGITIPTIYVISNRKLVHVSSSAIRAIRKIDKQS